MASESLSLSSLSESSSSSVHSPQDQDSVLNVSSLLPVQYLRQSSPGGSASGSSSTTTTTGLLNCRLCYNFYSSPRVLPCLHSFCKVCLEGYVRHCDPPLCPICKTEFHLPRGGVEGLPPDYVTDNFIKSFPGKFQCLECKRDSSVCVARCIYCDRVLCHSCLGSHSFSDCGGGGVGGEDVIGSVVNGGGSLREIVDENGGELNMEVTLCLIHVDKEVSHWCLHCEEVVCEECLAEEHSDPALHRCEPLDNVSPHLLSSMRCSLAEWQVKLRDLAETSRFNDRTLASLASQFTETQAKINDTFSEFRSLLVKHYREQLETLERAYTTLYSRLEEISSLSGETYSALSHACDFYSRLFKHASLAQCLLFKSRMDAKNKLFSGVTCHRITAGFKFIPDMKALCNSLPDTFGLVMPHVEDCDPAGSLLPPYPPSPLPEGFDKLARQILSAASIPTPLEKKSKQRYLTQIDGNTSYRMLDLLGTPKITLPMKSYIHRQQMTYSWKFGAYGSLEGQFTEPNGVALNKDDDIVIADTNNNRVQLFNKFGKFKYQFGCLPNLEGNLLFPNRVAVTTDGDVVVTERAPTHQVQVYNQYGQFVRKFGSDILHYPRAVAVDNDDYIIIVECRIMRVVIFDKNGNLVQRFSCGTDLQFPNGVAVYNGEIFISDNRSHCVVVYDYEGNLRRRIGCEGLTNYPIGVLIARDGSVLVADNHNNFNLTVFTTDGELIGAYESKVKHSQCYDVAISPTSGILALTCKDFHVYLYQHPNSTN